MARKPLYEIRMQRRAQRDLQRLSDEDMKTTNESTHAFTP